MTNHEKAKGSRSVHDDRCKQYQPRVAQQHRPATSRLHNLFHQVFAGDSPRYSAIPRDGNHGRQRQAGTDHDASTHKIALPNACFTDRGFVCGSDLRLCSGQLRSFKGRARQPEIGKRSTLVELAIVSGGSDLLLKANVIISDGRG